jgi:hypothetical protein
MCLTKLDRFDCMQRGDHADLAIVSSFAQPRRQHYVASPVLTFLCVWLRCADETGVQT